MTNPVQERPSWELPPPERRSPKKRRAPATKFLWLVALLITGAVSVWWLFNAFAPTLLRTTFVPEIAFPDSPQAAQPDYTAQGSWIAHPDIEQSPALATPADYHPAARAAADVFYLGPDAYLSARSWNDPLTNSASKALRLEAVRHEASAFNSVGVVWAPLIRQATIGAHYSQSTDARAAVDLAYSDAQAAFDAFLVQRDPDRPFYLVGHGQGALMAKRLLADRIADATLSQTLIAAYLLGWPVIYPDDLQALNMRACQDPGDIRCLISWASFAEPADPSQLLAAAAWLERKPARNATSLVCTNPLSGTRDNKLVGNEAHHGALAFNPVPNGPLTSLVTGLAGARCSPEGVLIVSPRPKAPFAERALPGNDFTRYDITLFWADIRLDAEARLKAFMARRTAP